MHGRRLGNGAETIRSFEDGRVMQGIRHLKETLMKDRLDGWFIKHMGILSRRVGTSLKGGEVPDVTLDDEVSPLASTASTSLNHLYMNAAVTLLRQKRLILLATLPLLACHCCT